MAVVTTAATPSGAERGLILAPLEGDYVDLPSGKSAADVIARFNSETAGSGSLAFWIEAASDASKRGPVNCLQQVPSEAYALRGIPEGQHRIHAVLWQPQPGAAEGAQPTTPEELAPGGGFTVRSHANVSFFVRRFEDFLPSYDWNVVERWHRLPPGLEVSLDLGEGGSRKARIPQPWQWDVRVLGESGEATKQRVAVEAETSMAELLSRLGLSDSTHEIVWSQEDGKHERLLQPSWTARQADLFRYSSQIFVRRFATVVD
eukprot:TRINITY_DN114632_c0_g1_i1.p1 TRINITY_DN114632_c0_g1~~TRINITY_DN114632_c0_g1_i1.p1  ORF type:complete len:261 (-),score=60.38 TRINITY_DN114632_c0_g1_i1:42-824(-)